MAGMRLETWLARLDQARMATVAEGAGICLDALRAAPGPAVVRAVGLLRRMEFDGFAEPARDAFARLCPDGRRQDPGCAGRSAIAEALLAQDWNHCEPWLGGIRLVQWEPVFGGRVDTAAGLRGLCALGLVRSDDARAPLALARLLADPRSEARRGAIRALREAPESWALPLLAHRAVAACEEPDVQLDLYHGLLERSQPDGLALVADALDAERAEDREAAAMALGERGGAAGAELLWERLEDEPLRERRRPFWLGLALSRVEEGRGRLLERLAAGECSLAREVEAALDGVLDDELRLALAAAGTTRRGRGA